MSSHQANGGKDYMLISAVVGLLAFFSLAGLLSSVMGGLGGLVTAAVLTLPAAATASFADGGGGYRATALSLLVFVSWIGAVLASFFGWADTDGYESGGDLAFLFVTACATLVAIMAMTGVGVGYSLGRRRHTNAAARDLRDATRSDGKHADV